jgi:hypothetical protein
MHDGSIFQVLRRASRLLWSSPQLRPVLAAVRRCCTAATPLVMATALIPSVALGEGWTIRPTGLPTGINTGSLSSVSCLSATLCIAVGGASDFNGNVTNAVVLAEMWNGIGWIPMPVPGPSGDVPSLAGVSCLSATSCVAVGSVSPSSSSLTRPLAEAWNGTRWALLSAKDPGTRYGAGLSAVSCVSATDCEAVGTVFYPDRPYEIAHALVERWNGTAWRIVGTQTPTLGLHRGTSLSGVSCVAANACTAVGGVERAVASANSTPLAERWNGRSWSIASVRHPAAALLEGVSCTSVTNCVAVGADADDQTVTAPAVAEHWNGKTWSSAVFPTITHVIGNLTAVSCASSKACTAVGTIGPGVIPTGFKRKLLAYRWNGRKWLPGYATQPAQGFSALLGVSCTSTADCTAIGQHTRADEHPLAEDEGRAAG